MCHSFDRKLFYTHLDLCVSFVRRATSCSRSTENFFTHFWICACHSCAGPLPHVPFVGLKTFLHTSGFVRVIRAQGHFLQPLDRKLFYTLLGLCVSFMRRATSACPIRSTENFFTPLPAAARRALWTENFFTHLHAIHAQGRFRACFRLDIST
jgi:hypothetical protein